VTAEELLIKGEVKQLGWLKGNEFITCKGERLKIDNGIVKTTTDTCYPPPHKELDKPVVGSGAPSAGAVAGSGAAAGVGAGTIAAAAIGAAALIAIILLLL